MAKMKTTVGVAAGIFDGPGRLLLVRRTQHDSVTDTDYYGNWELPITAVQTNKRKPIPYNYLSQELERGTERELGIRIHVDPMPVFYPVAFKNKNGYDLLLATPIHYKQVEHISGILAQFIFVDVDTLDVLAREFISLSDAKKQGFGEAKGLLSGYGKRQHQVSLKLFSVASSDRDYREQAKDILKKCSRDCLLFK